MKLLEPLNLGPFHLKNRMLMAAMTRSRAAADGTPVGRMALYYRQRASAGLILSEAINISPAAIGSPLTPGIYSAAQIEGWRAVTRAVHEAGGLIFAQLWHTGRVGHSADRGGALPLAPSAVRIEGMQHFTSQGLKDFETPQAMSLQDIAQTQADYAQAARNAIEAGFDGVQLHAANGYLPQQFLAESSNRREDAYGGSIAGRARFTLEVMQALIAAVGGARVGIKISPLHPYAGIAFDDPLATYRHLLGELARMDFAFVELMKRAPMFPLLPHYPQGDEIELFAPLIAQTLVAGTGYGRASGEAELQKGRAQLIAYGSAFLANPDLPRRFALDAPLNAPDRATMFGGADQGYTDYPALP